MAVIIKTFTSSGVIQIPSDVNSVEILVVAGGGGGGGHHGGGYGKCDLLRPNCHHGGDSWFCQRALRAGYKFVDFHNLIEIKHIGEGI